MIEIKFRAWDKKNNQWYRTELDFYGFGLFGECTLVCPPKLEDLEHLEISQYLGMMDKNGKEVYDGDIYVNGESGLVGYIRIGQTIGGYIPYATEKKDGRICTNVPFIDLDLTDYEIIDNIYENKKGLAKELLA